MTQHQDRYHAIKTLGEKIKGIRTAMLTTEHDDGTLISRPMATLDVEFDGELWFFTYADAHKVGDIRHDQQVNLSYVNEHDNRYVSVSGTAQLVRDRATIDELWKPFLKAWFPKGNDDPNLALLKVTVHSAQFWEGPHNTMTQLLGIAKNFVTASHDTGGESETIELQ